MTDDAQAPVLAALGATHLPQALALSTEMGWPYRLEDLVFAHGLGEGLALEHAGRLIGTAMRWDYGPAFSSVGMIIVSRAFQGRGLGARLVDALLDGVSARNVFLNATQEAFALYRRRGFVVTGELHQHQGVLAPDAAFRRDARVRVAGEADRPLIERLDQAAAGMPRQALLARLMEVGQTLVLDDRAYAISRAFGRGHVVGPVVAPSLDDACALVEAGLSRLGGEFVRVDTSADSGLAPWLEARGLARVDTASAMLRGAPPQASGTARIYALASQSLG